MGKQTGGKKKEVFIPDNPDFIGGMPGVSMLMLKTKDKTPATKERRVVKVEADAQGRPLLTPEMVTLLGLNAQDGCEVVFSGDHLELRPNIHALTRLYIEPTAQCNLNCQTCIRKTWNEPLGRMAPEVFDSLAAGLKEIPTLKTVMFGGFGEPTFHPDFPRMLGAIKSMGLRAELTTNGTLLSEEMLKKLFELELDMLWISIDGADAGSFEDLRAGASFNKVMANMRNLRRMNKESTHQIKVGLAWVAMKRNLHELKHLNHLAKHIGAERVSISNVIPYSAEMQQQMLYNTTLYDYLYENLQLSIPSFDINDETWAALYPLYKSFKDISLFKQPVTKGPIHCRFVDDRCAFVRWDGAVAPCMGLLHHYTTFLHKDIREIKPYLLGQVQEKPLAEIWESAEYRGFREKVSAFEFSPCHVCMGCELSKSNEEDCFGSGFPACGGCLWAQNIIQCP